MMCILTRHISSEWRNGNQFNKICVCVSTSKTLLRKKLFKLFFKKTLNIFKQHSFSALKYFTFIWCQILLFWNTHLLHILIYWIWFHCKTNLKTFENNCAAVTKFKGNNYFMTILFLWLFKVVANKLLECVWRFCGIGA